MRRVSAEVGVAVPRYRAWAVLSDLTAMEAYMPGLASVELTSDEATGE